MTLDAIICMDLNGIITSWNPQAEKIFGWSEIQIVGKSLANAIIPEQYRARHYTGIQKYLETGTGVMMNRLIEITSLNRNQEEFPIELFITPIQEQENKFFCAFIRDIAERKKGEEKAAKERDLSNSFINSLPGIFYMYDSYGKFIRWNKNFETVSAYTASEISSMHPLDFFTSDEKELVKKRIADVFDNGHAEVEADFFTRDKKRIPYYFNGYAVEFNGVKCLTGMGVDITNLRRATESHRQAEERYRDIFENAIVGIYQTTPEGQFITVNPSLAKMFGYLSGEDMINSITDLGTQLYASPDDRVKLKMVLEKDGYVFNLELKLKKKDGEIIWVRANDRAIKDENGKIKYFEGTLQDITARKEAEEKLRLQQQLNEIIIRAQALFISSEDSRHAFDTLLNDLLDITQSEYGFIGEVLSDKSGQPYLKTHTITNIAWNEETKKFYSENIESGIIFSNLKTLFGRVMTTGNPVISNSPAVDPGSGGLPPGHPPLDAFLGLPFGSEGKIEGMLGLSNRPDGYDQELIEFLGPLVSTLTHLIKASKNEKLRKQIEIELHQQFEDLQKTNSELDHFVYSVSHDLRAPLASILGLVNVAEMEEPMSTQNKYLDMIRSSVNRLDGFIRDILDYSKNSRTDLRCEKIDFRKIISESETRLNSIKGSERISFTVHIDASVAFYSDEGRIEIILSNLMNNAIKYQDYHKESSFAFIDVSITKDNAFIRFADNGTGIGSEHLNKIFDMFYRATDKAMGSGIGLYIVKEAILKLNTVYGLRFLFRCEGLDDRAIKLPHLKRDNKLPVVLGRAEMKEFLSTIIFFFKYYKV